VPVKPCKIGPGFGTRRDSGIERIREASSPEFLAPGLAPGSRSPRCVHQYKRPPAGVKGRGRHGRALGQMGRRKSRTTAASARRSTSAAIPLGEVAGIGATVPDGVAVAAAVAAWVGVTVAVAEGVIVAAAVANGVGVKVAVAVAVAVCVAVAVGVIVEIGVGVAVTVAVCVAVAVGVIVEVGVGVKVGVGVAAGSSSSGRWVGTRNAPCPRPVNVAARLVEFVVA